MGMRRVGTAPSQAPVNSSLLIRDFGMRGSLRTQQIWPKQIYFHYQKSQGPLKEKGLTMLISLKIHWKS